MKEFALYASVLTIIAVSFLTSIVFESYACSSRWETTMVKTSYGPFKGCMVQTKDGRWLPERAIKEELK